MSKENKSSRYKKLTAKDLRLPKGVDVPRLEKLTAQDYKSFLLNGFKPGLVTLEQAAYLVHGEDPDKPEAASANVKMTFNWLKKELSRRYIEDDSHKLHPFETSDGKDYFTPGDIFRHMTARDWKNYSTISWSVLHEMQTGHFDGIVQQKISDENYVTAFEIAKKLIPGAKKPFLISEVLRNLPNRVRNAKGERVFLTVADWYLNELLKLPGNKGGRGKKAIEEIPEEQLQEVFEAIEETMANVSPINQSKN